MNIRKMKTLAIQILRKFFCNKINKNNKMKPNRKIKNNLLKNIINYINK